MYYKFSFFHLSEYSIVAKRFFVTMILLYSSAIQEMHTKESLLCIQMCSENAASSCCCEGGSLLNNANAVHLTEYVCLYIPMGRMSFLQVDNSFLQTNLPTTQLCENDLYLLLLMQKQLRLLLEWRSY